MGLREIRERNLRKYSPESRAELDRALATRLPFVISLSTTIAFALATSPSPGRWWAIAVCAVGLAVSTYFLIREDRAMWRALRALRASRRAYNRAHETQPSETKPEH
jgi:hypothetical protein